MDTSAVAQRKLTNKQKKFVAEKVMGKNNIEAYTAAYDVKSKDVAKAEGSRLYNKPHIQDAINQALELHGATPEWAVKQLMYVAQQDEEIGAKRLAAKDILELHGWNKSERPTNVLSIQNAFFANSRKKQDGHQETIEAETTE